MCGFTVAVGGGGGHIYTAHISIALYKAYHTAIIAIYTNTESGKNDTD